DRRKQFETLSRYIESNVPPEAMLILAGDFNDWRDEASVILRERVGLSEVFRTLNGECAKSFPARMPMLPLDRIYVRGLKPMAVEVHRGLPWARLSDHLPLSTLLLPL
ncbi:endonuclease/exonuclease/phosphatase family protein, partial [Craterilacuibacter sp.]|uniref:endonuclease/exonuclease/phosphatase family protein n=1 Tax=Craterilacuibacter sp. TaxID=2870909 RepID=UPI003F3CCAC9